MGGSVVKKKEKIILDAMYEYGRGYITIKLAMRVLKVSQPMVKRILDSLLQEDYISVYYSEEHRKKYRIYRMTNKSIELWNIEKDEDYLKRMMARREKYDLVKDKIAMFRYFVDNIHSGTIISPYQKTKLFTEFYSIPLKELKKTHLVKQGEKIFFNDLMMCGKDNNIKALKVMLFPRSKVLPKTFLTDFLIRQYYLINYYLKGQGIDISFRIVVTNPYFIIHYENVIKTNSIFKVMSGMDTQVQSFYKESSEKNTNGDPSRIYLNSFDIDVYSLEKSTQKVAKE